MTPPAPPVSSPPGPNSNANGNANDGGSLDAGGPRANADETADNDDED